VFVHKFSDEFAEIKKGRELATDKNQMNADKSKIEFICVNLIYICGKKAFLHNHAAGI
jgi:hypothetical protein